MNRLLRVTLFLVVLAFAGGAALIAALCIGHRVSVTLPAPRGPFAVSRAIEVWSDARRADPLFPERRTELVVWMWYPCAPSSHRKPAEYVPADWRRHMGRGIFGTLLWRDPAVVHAHSAADAPLSPAQSRYPVVILRGGLGAASTQYTTLAEEMASHGDVVIAFDAPYRSGMVVFPDGRVVYRPQSLNPETMPAESAERLAAKLLAAWVSDIAFVVDRLPSSRFSGPCRSRSGDLSLVRRALSQLS